MITNPLAKNFTCINKVLKSYPNSTDIRINEVFNPSEGWIKMWGVNLVNLTEENLNTAKKKGCTYVNIILTDEFGQTRYPDFSIKELEF